MGQADLHIHTTYSKDGTTTVRGVLKQASNIGLNVVAITDHDEIRGSLVARELAPQYRVEVIPAMEVSAREGHVLALFIEKPIPAGRSLIETLLRIGEQGGIAIAPHPVNPLPKSLPMEALVGAVAHQSARHVLRGLEVYNMGHQIFNHLAQKISPWLPLAKTAGSDSHVYWTVGIGQTGFAGFTAADLRRALENMATIPIPAPTKFTLAPILGWMGQTVLRRFGYVAQNFSLDTPIVIRRNSLDRPTVPNIKERRP
jgi:predicted metal-dependent phosphoesterase TrpH